MFSEHCTLKVTKKGFEGRLARMVIVDGFLTHFY